MTANWTARASDKWTVPVGGGVGKLFKIGPLPVNTQNQGFYNADRPRYTSDWQLRFQLQFLLPSREEATRLVIEPTAERLSQGSLSAPVLRLTAAPRARVQA